MSEKSEEVEKEVVENEECCGQGCGCHEENMEKMEEMEEIRCQTAGSGRVIYSDDEDDINVEEAKADSEIAQDLMSQSPASPPPLTLKELKALKRSKYMQKKDSFDKAFIIRNKRTGQIVEINATNAYQAAGFVGWRPRHIETLEVHDVKKEEPKAVEASVDEKEKEKEE
jgi:hypothetical protein